MRYSPADFVDADDIAAEKARSPHARQLCHGSNTQVMEDAGEKVACLVCGKTFTDFTTQKNRDRVHPVVPSHITDWAGAAKIADKKHASRHSNTPRPF